MTRYIYLLLTIFCTITLTAQNLDNDYIPLKAKGNIPQEILTSSSKKYEESKETITRDDNRKTRKDKAKFYLQSSFVIDEMMRSGKILFNDDLSIYVNKVADKLLAHNPTLRKELNFYIVKSPTVNAFATDRGSIFINIGLLARLEDEAQLAYILAHEIVHYQNKHNIQSYIEFAEIDRNNGYNRNRSYDQLLEKNNYSKELEREADNKGLEIFAQSKYSFESLPRVFDILGLSHAPYTNIAFSPTFLETPYIKFDSTYILTKVDEIEQYEDDDKESTHPSISERRSTLIGNLLKLSEANKQKFLVSETDFNDIRQKARFELCHLYTQRQDYVKVVYHTYALLKEHPNNQFLRKSLGNALYGLAQYKNAERYDEILPYDYKNYQGEIQKVYYLFEKIDEKDLNVLAAVHTWKLHQEFPDSKGLEYTAKDMMEDLVIFQIEKPFEFFQSNQTSTIAKADRNFARYGFIDMIQNETVIEWLKNGEKYRKKHDEEKEAFESRKGKKIAEKKKKKERSLGQSLGIDKIAFINPMYININIRKDTPYRFIESEETQKKFKGMIEENGKKLDMETAILDMKNLSSDANGIETYQNIVVINNWIEEYLSHDMFMINSNYDEAVAVSEKLGFEYFAYAGAISYKKDFNLMKAYGTAAYLVLLPPFGISGALRSPYECLHFNLVFNIKQNRKVLTEVNYATFKGKDIIIQQNLYWAMLQMKRASKKK